MTDPTPEQMRCGFAQHGWPALCTCGTCSPPDDYEDDAPMICPMTQKPCIRAFCDEYGCADKARVPITEDDIACGSIYPEKPVPRIPRARRKK